MGCIFSLKTCFNLIPVTNKREDKPEEEILSEEEIFEEYFEQIGIEI